jgi:hypothetical protein
MVTDHGRKIGSPFSTVDNFVVETLKFIRSCAVHHDRVVPPHEVVDGLACWLAHVGGHELEHL